MLTEKEIKEMQMQVAGEEAQKLARLYAILSDPTRIRIIDLLILKKELCVTELALILKVSAPAISHHLRSLHDLEIVSSHRMGQEVCYMLTDTVEARQIVSAVGLLEK